MKLFALSSAPLEAAALEASLAARDAGAFAAFEGWVRNHNLGRSVCRLEYEAFDALAIREGRRIVTEALDRFDLIAARCVHRTGNLEVGELAVWVGACAVHRDAAFAACRYIIDQVKGRVPIWKKEFYDDGDSGWINCENCAGARSPQDGVGVEELYARQISLPEIGPTGQDKLGNSRVLVVGAGGLGSPALLYLAGAGVGHIGICEGDALEASNLHRQVLYTRDQLGEAKAGLAQKRLHRLNPDISLERYDQVLDPDNVEALFGRYDLILDCTDDLRLKFLMNAAALKVGKPLIFASVYQYEGQLHVVDPAADTPCLRCLWPDEPRAAPGCSESGVLGPVPGVFGALQAMEAIKQLLGLPGRLQGELLMFDLLGYRSARIKAKKVPECEICSREPDGLTLPALMGEPADIELEWSELGEAPWSELEFIDIREAGEVLDAPLHRDHSRHIPMTVFPVDMPPLERDRRYLLCCAHGVRSLYLAEQLRQRGWDNVFSLKGGVAKLEP